ncbi:outer membrane beta-barrel protein [Mucilaginibacter sp. SMC90]|uniref:outer membrane beta-barrel protein n=1 Tax=Mucilaginibacter sp. SMC90 TaxID=2929803 RepID=UPI001FB3A860|nr:outer membrane beta-barrel protein [Mucilaginibacter sp. SMC90]UOE49484.1 outer membrane beta-barrel protein [Mucilaginibacter sp. SMC90]
MKPLLLILSFILLSAFGSYAQTGREVKGTVVDSTKLSLPGSSVKLVSNSGDSTIAIADATGKFSFPVVKGNKLTLTITSIGFTAIKKHYSLDAGTQPVDLGAIVLKAETNMLNQVTIVGVNPVVLKEDTTEYKVSAYPVRENAPVEDVLKKLPGVDVDKDGNVTAQGKSVTKVRVNGKDFFGGDVKTATKNLPADVVESIQVIDDYGDQANLTGIKTGEPDKILNITIRKDKNKGYFGQATAGDGEDYLPKDQGIANANRYIGDLKFFNFNNDQQIAVLGTINNTNVNTFTYGSATSGGGGGFGGGGGGRGNALRGSSGSTTSANGITNAHSIGANFRDQWGKNVSVYGSYSFTDNTTNTVSSSIQTNNFQTPSVSTQKSNQTDNPINHRFNFNIEWKPDTINYFKIVPNFTYSSTNTDANESVSSTIGGLLDQSYRSLSHSDGTSPSYGINVLYNHRFNAHGRNLSININANSSKTSQFDNPTYQYDVGSPQTAPANQQIFTDSRVTSVGTNLSYLEPISKRGYLELNYAFNRSSTTSDKETDTLSAANTFNNYALLSNNYKYNFTTNRVGLNYRFIEKKYNLTLGVGVQPATLNGLNLKNDSATHITTFNVIPTARFSYNFSRGKGLNFLYNGSSNQPTFTQLQPVIDFSNALYPVQGNPNLKPEFANNFSLRYNNFSFQTGNIFFTNFNFTTTQNKIVQNTITYPRKFSQAALAADPSLKNLQSTNLTNYMNADGYYSGTANVVYAKPWAERKFTLQFNGALNYTNGVAFSNTIDSNNVAASATPLKNIAKNLNFTPGLKFRVNIVDIIDAEASSSYGINKTTNSIHTQLIDGSSNFRTLTLGLSGKNYFWKDWTLSYDFTRTVNYGYDASLDIKNPNILNAYVERRFLKDHRATIRLAAYDLFNQNTGYTSVVNGNITTQSTVNRLGRYYLLSFTFRLQKFAGKAPTQEPGQRRFNRDGGGPGGPGGGGPGGGGPGGPGSF